MKKNNISIKDIVLVFLPILILNILSVIINLIDLMILFVSRILGDFSVSPNETAASVLNSDYNSPWNNAIVTFFVYVTYCIVFSIWYKKLSNSNTDFSIVFTHLFKSYRFYIIIFLGIACQFMVSSFLIIITPLFKTTMKEYSDLIDNAIGNNVPWLLMLTIFVIAPIAEEVIFRGLILNYASTIMPVAFAILTQAFLFSVFHSNIVQQVYAFILGLLLGYIAYTMKSIVSTILLHISINLSTLLLPDYNLMDTKKITMLFLVSVVALVILMIIILKLNKHKPSHRDQPNN